MNSSDDLLKKKCGPCEGSLPAVLKGEALKVLTGLSDWKLAEDAKSIRKEYVMKDFMAAIRLINEIAKLAEDENHHPDIHLAGYRKLQIELATHSIGGLSENDFILAAKIEKLPKELKPPKG